MSQNLLKNSGFEAEWSEEESHRCLVLTPDAEPEVREIGNIFTPPSWLTWFRHDPGTWDQPEVKDAWRTHDPRRVHSGQKAMKLFTFHRKHDAGFLQQVSVEPDTRMRLTAWAHAWSNHPIEGHRDCAGDPRCSCGVGRGPAFLLEEEIPPLNGDPWNDAIGNVSFMLGVDPTGGKDPDADTVIWGPQAHIYNEHYQVPALEAVAETGTVTVFLRSKTRWPFKHNDVYWDDVELVAVEEPPEPGPVGWEYPVIRKGAKIGVHSIRPNEVGGFAQNLVAGGTEFSVVKGMDDLGWLPGVREISPASILIARLRIPNEGCSGVEDPGFDLEGHARASLDRILEKIEGDPRLGDVVDYWEVYNEPDPPGREGYRRLAELMIETMELAEEEGLKVAIFSLNAGTPEWDEMEAMVATGVFGRAKAGGHVLALHEGTFDTHDPRAGWGSTIPGSPAVEGAGALNFRYRYLYHLLKQRGEVVPLVVSEWYCGDEASASTETLVEALTWYDGEASKDYYFWGVCPFTLGPTSGWRHTDYERVYPGLVDYMIGIRRRQNALPPEEEPDYECVPPRVPYERSYVLLPQIGDPVERLEWRTAVAIGSSQTRQTVGHSADDAGVGPPERFITAVNAEVWGADLRSWYEEHYPGASYRAIEADAPWDAAIHLLPELGESVAIGQSDPRWKDYDFGEEPGGGTVGEYGCLLTGLAMILRNVYRRSVTPPHLDKLLVAARAAFIDDDVLLWGKSVSLFSAFDDSFEDDKQRSLEQLETLRNAGWEIILEVSDLPPTEGEHYVYVEHIGDAVLHVIDTWDGKRSQIAAEECRSTRAAHVRAAPTTPTFDVLASDVELGRCVPPRDPYDRTYVLLPQMTEDLDLLVWRVAAAIGSYNAMQTVGHSADDAGVGPLRRRIIAVNPDRWGDDLEAWYDEHYPGAQYRAVEAKTPWDMAVKVLDELEEDIALAQIDERWRDYDFGEHPDIDRETIGRYGCFLTGLAVILRKIYRRDVTPPMLDKLLVAARSAYVNDNLMAWTGAVSLFPLFVEAVKDNEPRSALELSELLDEGWEIILRRADGKHFVYLEDVRDSVLHIIDTWDGRRKQRSADDYLGIRAALVRKEIPGEPAPILIGLHDEAGGEWMVDHAVAGCCVVPAQVQREPVQLDFEHLYEAGIIVIARLNWGYHDGTGTLPGPRFKGDFIDAVVESILSAKGVDYFHIGNEPNNRREHPGFGIGGEFVLTPEYVSEIYNEIWRRVDGRAQLGPPPIDPYYGPGSNSRRWWTYVLEHIAGADALFLHAKTQTNDPDEVWSREKFSDWPLEWQYQHLAAIETSLEAVPDKFQGLPIFVTELNPQRLVLGKEMGWKRDNSEWVRQAVRYFREKQPVTGLAFFRYTPGGDQAPFALENSPAVLGAIKEAARAQPVSAIAAADLRPLGLPSRIWRRILEAQR